jgi:mRNA-degrading endonuclease YafQ of YafQ-DinJ toxin-antitoxin module
MIVQHDPAIFKKLKNVDVRIRKSFYKQIGVFEKNPFDPSLNNHELKEPYQGLRSINITNDYRAIYEEVSSGSETVAYFSLLGTHKELYKK